MPNPVWQQAPTGEFRTSKIDLNAADVLMDSMNGRSAIDGRDVGRSDQDLFALDFRTEAVIAKLHDNIDAMVRAHHAALHQDFQRSIAQRVPLSTAVKEAGVSERSICFSDMLEDGGDLPARCSQRHSSKLSISSSLMPVADVLADRFHKVKKPNLSLSRKSLGVSSKLSHISPLPSDKSTQEIGMICRFVRSKTFEETSGVCILLNAIFLGARASIMSDLQTDDEPTAVVAATACFTSLFVLELCLRIGVYGTELFKHDLAWNIFDVVIIVASTVQFLLEQIFSVRSFSVLGIIRSIRVVRVARAIRYIPVLRPLYQLVSSIVVTLASGFWALFLMCMIMYSFSLVFADATTKHLYGQDHCRGSECENDDDLVFYFGSPGKALGTLFQSISGGVSWGEALHAIGTIDDSGWMYEVIFLFYVSFTFFAVLNVVTALFCQQAVEHTLASEDPNEKAVRILRACNKTEIKLVELFTELDEIEQSDESPPGMVTKSDLDLFMEDERVSASFALLGIEPWDSEVLFRLLDAGEVGMVPIEDFVDGCMKLRGDAQRLDLYFMFNELKHDLANLHIAVESIGGHHGHHV